MIYTHRVLHIGAPSMRHSSPRRRAKSSPVRATRLPANGGAGALRWPIGAAVSVLLVLLAISGCGSGSSSTASGGNSGSANSSFQARPFPGDFFIRPPNWWDGRPIPDEIYDPLLKEVFISNVDINAVDVYSTTDGHLVGQIDVPAPYGLDFNIDDSELVIGTNTPSVYFADPTKLHITGHFEIPASDLQTMQTYGVSPMPLMPYVMADGTIFIGCGGGQSPGGPSDIVPIGHLMRFDPQSNAFTLEDLNSNGTHILPAKSLDGKYLIVPGPNGNLSVYSTDAQGYVASAPAPDSTQAGNSLTWLAANPDGSQFAAATSYRNTQTVWLLGANLQTESQYTSSAPIAGHLVFSRDGKYLYVSAFDQTINVLDATTGQSAGAIAAYLGSGTPSGPRIFDVDDSYHLFAALSIGGAAIINADQPQPPPLPVLSQFGLPVADVGPLAGGTQVIFSPGGVNGGNGITNSTDVYFGARPATQEVITPNPGTVDPGNTLTATTPPGANPGPVGVVLTDPNNNAVFLPDAFTYGPRVLRVQPNVASAQGGDFVTLYAYGLGQDGTDVHVTIGGVPAAVQYATFNRFASFDYPEESIAVMVPAGTPGWADVVVTTSNGSDTLHRGLQYLNSEVSLPGGPFTFAIYDSVRDLFYLTGAGNSVAVFDPGTGGYSTPLQAAGVSAGAVLQGEALTPDSSKLLVADPADDSVVIFDRTDGTSTMVNVGLPSDPVSPGAQPLYVATAANNRAFVSLSPCITDPVREIDLTTLSVSARPDGASTCVTYQPYPGLGDSSSDGNTIIFAGFPPGSPVYQEFLWRYDAGSDKFSGPVITSDEPWLADHAAVDADAGVIAVSGGTLDQQLQPLVPMERGGAGSVLNETGSLLYNAWGPVVLQDTRNGREVLMLGVLNNEEVGFGRPLAISPSGKKILLTWTHFGATVPNGISYFELSVIPLAVGTVSPAQGPAGTTITIRGSGFVVGTIVQIAGQNAPCTDLDNETLSCTVPNNLSSGAVPMTLANPDGQTYSLENAFTVQ